MNKPEWYTKLPLDLIAASSSKYGLDPLLVAAICQHESGGVCWRTRSEVRPGQEKYLQFYREHALRLGISQETEKLAQMHSYGLMQIMGWLARSYNYDDYLVKLCDPALNIEYGCNHLQKLFQRFDEEASIISAYNQGSPRKINGLYVNQKYVDSVHKHLLELRKLS